MSGRERYVPAPPPPISILSHAWFQVFDVNGWIKAKPLNEFYTRHIHTIRVALEGDDLVFDPVWGAESSQGTVLLPDDVIINSASLMGDNLFSTEVSSQLHWSAVLFQKLTSGTIRIACTLSWRCRAS